MQLIHQISLRYLEKLSGTSRRRRRIIIIKIIRRKTIRTFPLKGKDLNNQGKIDFFAGEMSLWQILISLRHNFSPYLTPLLFYIFSIFSVMVHRSLDKPYIHFVALEKTNLLSYQVYEKSAFGFDCPRFLHLLKTWECDLELWPWHF